MWEREGKRRRSAGNGVDEKREEGRYRKRDLREEQELISLVYIFSRKRS